MWPDELPNTIEQCHALILQQAEINQQQAVVIQELQEMLARLQDDMKLLKRALYGNRRERFSADAPGQTYLFASEAESNESESPPEDSGEEPKDGEENESDDKSPLEKPSPGRGRRVFPGFLARERKEHPLADDEIPKPLQDDPNAKRFFKKVREELEYTPGKLVVVEHFKEVIATEDQAGETQIVTAAEPPRLIESYAGASLLALIVTIRFGDHSPYYRDEDILSRLGYRIHRGTQCRWMQAVATSVMPLIELMRQRVIASNVLQMDETVIPLVDESIQRTRNSYLWLARGDSAHPYNCFWFTPTRKRAGPAEILADFRGTLLSDAYSAYESITKELCEQMSWASCASHARRKFDEVEHVGPNANAKYALEVFRKLYDIEDRAKDLDDMQRQTLRDREARPIWESFHAWMQQEYVKELPKSRVRSAMFYMLGRWETFTRYLDDGAIPIDNNRSEAALKDPIIGRKNWLFFQTETGGQTAAILYTLTSTCKRLCIDVYAYLNDVFHRLPSATAEELERLLPDNWLAAHLQHLVQQRVNESIQAADRKRRRRVERRKASV
jgi:transposase